MSMQEFIFSEKAAFRNKRHLAFFGLLGIAFFLQSIVPGNSIYSTAFFSFCCFFPTCIFSTYACIYLFYPYFLQHKKYLLFFLGFIALSLFCLFINYHAAGLFLDLADDFGKPGNSFSKRMNLSFINTSHALIIGGLGLGIKLAKNIYLRQKENSLLSRQKIITDLRLEKARIYPRLLNQSLENLRTGINTGSINASTQLLKVSELLSYILYDNEEKWVLLEKELDMIKHLIDIQQDGRQGQPQLHINLSGDPSGKLIVPMTLFPLMENFFKILDDKTTDIDSVSLDLYIKNKDLDLRLAISKTPDQLPVKQWIKVFSNTCQRLEALHPGGCRVKIVNEDKIFIVLLSVMIKSSEDGPGELNHSTRVTYETA